MGRKNYSSKVVRKNTRANLARPLVMPDLGATVVDVYTVTLTNGSGSKTTEVYGTKESAWAYAQTCADHGVFGPGTWHPTGIQGKGMRVTGTPAFAAA